MTSKKGKAATDMGKAIEEANGQINASGFEPLSPWMDKTPENTTIEATSGDVADLAEEEGGELGAEDAAPEEATAPAAPAAAPGEEGGVFEPDQSWLTNPAPENEDEQIKQRDDLKLAGLRADRRILVIEARSHLKEEGAITLFNGTSKGQTHKYKTFTIFNTRTSLRKTGVLTIKFKLRSSQIDPMALSRYLATFANFKGTGAEAVDQIAHDLFILLRPRSVSVVYTTTEVDSDVTYESGHDWD